MWKYYTTKTKLFWNNNSIDKPSKEFINNLLWEEQNNILYQQMPSKLTVKINDDEINFLKVVNEEKNKTKYYYLEKVLEIKNGVMICEFNLDIWCTYNLDLFEKDIIVDTERNSDIFDDGVVAYDDPIVVTSELSNNGWDFWYEEIDDHVMPFEHKFNNRFKNTYYIVLSKDLFSKGVSKYSFIPILDSSKGELLYNTQIFKEENINKEVDVVLDFTNDIWQEYNFGNNMFGLTAQFNNEDGFFITKEYTLTDKMYFKYDNTDNKVEIYYKNKSKENLITKINYSNVLNIKYNYYTYQNDINNRPIIIRLNDIKNILDIIEEKKMSKQIVGLFLGPPVECFQKYMFYEYIQSKTDYVAYFNLDSYGNNILPLTLNKYIKCDLIKDFSKEVKWNNNKITNKLLLKYLNINMWGTDIDLTKYFKYNEYTKSEYIELYTYAWFTSSFSVFTDKYLLKQEEKILTFPAQQPLVEDVYKNYVQSNANSVDISWKIGQFTRMVDMVKSVVTMKPSGKGFLNMLGETGGTIFNGYTEAQKMKAKYQDSYNSMKNNLMYSSDKDMIWNYDVRREQIKDKDKTTSATNIFYYKKLTEDSIVKLNNSLLLNGVYNPKLYNIKNLPKITELKFLYAKLNPSNLNQQFSKYINTSISTKEMILKNMEEFRIWDIIPEIPL